MHTGHPLHTWVIVWVKDGQSDDSTLECWLSESAPDPKLTVGDKVTIEGSAMFLHSANASITCQENVRWSHAAW